jgi:hypothetical protein
MYNHVYSRLDEITSCRSIEFLESLDVKAKIQFSLVEVQHKRCTSEAASEGNASHSAE